MGETTRKPFSNCYVFAKVMHDNAELAREVAEIAVGRQVGGVEVIEVESEEDTVEARGVRFDVYLKAEGLLIALEMQASPEPLLPLRARYYHAWLDRRALGKGDDLREMPDAYVVFVCARARAGRRAAAYDAESLLRPRGGGPGEPLGDGSRTVVLDASGDLSGAAPEMAELLQYVADGVPGAPGSLTARLEAAVDKAYEDEEWVKSMGIMEVTKAMRERDISDRARAEGLSEGRAEGLPEGRAEGLSRGLSEGRASERAREAALLQAMRGQGHSLEDFAAAITGGDLDELYREYGVE